MLTVHCSLTPSCSGTMSKSSQRPRRPGEASPRQFRGFYEMFLMVCLVVYAAGYPVSVDSPGVSDEFGPSNPIAVAEQDNKSPGCLNFLSYVRTGEATCSLIEKAGEDCSPSFDTTPCSLEERRAGGVSGQRIYDKDGKKQEVVTKLKVRGDVGPPAGLDYIMPSWFRLRPDDTSDQEEKKKSEEKLKPEVVGGHGDKEQKKSRQKSKNGKKSEVVKLIVVNNTDPSLHLTFNLENVFKVKSGGKEFEIKGVVKGEGGEDGGEGDGEYVEEQRDEDEGEKSGGGEDVGAQDIAIFVCVVLASVFVIGGLAAGCFFLIHFAIKVNTVPGPVGGGGGVQMPVGASTSSFNGSSSSRLGSTASSTPSTVSIPIVGDDPERPQDRRERLDFDDGGDAPGAESSPRTREEDNTMPMAQYRRNENTRENTEEEEVFFAGQQAGQHVDEVEGDESEGAGQHVESKTGG